MYGAHGYRNHPVPSKPPALLSTSSKSAPTAHRTQPSPRTLYRKKKKLFELP